MWGVVYISEFSFFLFFGWKSKLWDHKLIGKWLCESQKIVCHCCGKVMQNFKN
jgi:hypothetical protein